MTDKLSPELFWAVATAFATSLFWVPHTLQRIKEFRIHDALRDPTHDRPTQAAWAQRAIRAHTNAIENLAVFAIFALALHITGTGTQLTANAAIVFFAARMAHYCIYSLGLPWLRTPMFAIGLAAQSILAFRLFGWL